ncbi:hypothetical protein F4778DRAFT_294378 [Xylariomycetidae sp. FL2044]|nr:hypothetical protein F4778DRAFT_294378 [Xylariomycetidae sp. FL2044]
MVQSPIWRLLSSCKCFLVCVSRLALFAGADNRLVNITSLSMNFLRCKNVDVGSPASCICSFAIKYICRKRYRSHP